MILYMHSSHTWQYLKRTIERLEHGETRAVSALARWLVARKTLDAQASHQVKAATRSVEPGAFTMAALSKTHFPTG